jgi:hypothetical protein
MKVLVSSEFIYHFNVCNQYDFRLKKLFYKLKQWFLEEFAEFDGYDRQVFSKYSCYDCHCSYMSEEDVDKCNDRNGSAFSSCWSSCEETSEHKHILKRYKMYYINEHEETEHEQVYHIPTDHFIYANYCHIPELIKYGGEYKAYEFHTRNRIGLKKDKQLLISERLNNKPSKSFMWLIKWFRNIESMTNEVSV